MALKGLQAIKGSERLSGLFGKFSDAVSRAQMPIGLELQAGRLYSGPPLDAVRWKGFARENAGAGKTSAKQLTSAEINQKNINDQGPWDPDTGQTVTAGNQKTIEAIYAPNSNRLEVGVVDEYGIAKAQTGDGSIHRDHQPSKAALIARAEELKGDALTPAERNRIINGGMTVNVPANVHRAGPTYGEKNTAALINSDKSDLASAAARDANAMVENARILSPEHAQVLEESSGIVKQRTNAEYDKWLLRQFDDD
jgi:hypothetical protein